MKKSPDMANAETVPQINQTYLNSTTPHGEIKNNFIKDTQIEIIKQEDYHQPNHSYNKNGKKNNYGNYNKEKYNKKYSNNNDYYANQETYYDDGYGNYNTGYDGTGTEGSYYKDSYNTGGGYNNNYKKSYKKGGYK